MVDTIEQLTKDTEKLIYFPLNALIQSNQALYEEQLSYLENQISQKVSTYSFLHSTFSVPFCEKVHADLKLLQESGVYKNMINSLQFTATDSIYATIQDSECVFQRFLLPKLTKTAPTTIPLLYQQDEMVWFENDVFHIRNPSVLQLTQLNKDFEICGIIYNKEVDFEVSIFSVPFEYGKKQQMMDGRWKYSEFSNSIRTLDNVCEIEFLLHHKEAPLRTGGTGMIHDDRYHVLYISKHHTQYSQCIPYFERDMMVTFILQKDATLSESIHQQFQILERHCAHSQDARILRSKTIMSDHNSSTVYTSMFANNSVLQVHECEYSLQLSILNNTPETAAQLTTLTDDNLHGKMSIHVKCENYNLFEECFQRLLAFSEN
jgi:hypothetical protein